MDAARLLAAPFYFIAHRADTVTYDRRQRERIIAVTRKGYSAAIAAALAALLAASCQQIFTTSLVKGLARDPSSYKFPANMAVSDAAYYLAQSQGDPAVAAALVTPLLNAASTGSFNQAAPLLAQAVIQSSGFEQGVSTVLGDLLSSSGPPPDFEALLAAFSSVSLGDQAWLAIDLIAGTDPLASPLSADQAYTLAIVAFIDLVNEDPSIDIGNPATLPDNPSDYFEGPQWDTINAMFTYAGIVPNGQDSQLAQAMQDFITALGGI